MSSRSMFMCFSNKKKRGTKKGPITQIRLSTGIVIQEGRLISSSKNQSVFEGLVSPRGDRVTVKKIRLPEPIDREVDFLRELAETISSWDIQNLVKYVGVDFNPNTYELIMVTEFIPNDFVEIKRFTYKESQIRDYARALLNLLKNLFERDIKFIDLKPSNLLADNSAILYVRDYIVPDIIEDMKNSGDKNWIYESTDVLQRGLKKDFQGLIDIIKELYKVHDTTKGEILISKECSDFFKAINECLNKEIFLEDYERLLNHSYLVNTDTPSNRKGKQQIRSDGGRIVENKQSPLTKSEYPASRDVIEEPSKEDPALIFYINSTTQKKQEVSWRDNLRIRLEKMKIKDPLKDGDFEFKREKHISQSTFASAFDKKTDELKVKALDNQQKDVVDEMMRLFNAS